MGSDAEQRACDELAASLGLCTSDAGSVPCAPFSFHVP